MSVSVGFSYIKGNPLSWLIRVVTKAPCSHAFLVIDDSYFGVPMVLEADITGFSMTAYDRFKRSNTVVALLEPVVSLDAATQAAFGALGEQYDFLGLVGMAWVELGRFFHKIWKNPMSSGSAMFCSEAVVQQVLQPAKYPGAETLVPQDTAPADLLAFLLASGAKQKSLL